MQIYNKTDKIKSKSNKIIKIVLLSIFSLFTFVGVIGTFAGSKTIGGALLSKNMINIKIDTLDYSKPIKIKNKVTKKIVVSYSSLKNYTWYKVNLIEDTNLSGNLKVKRDYNFKSSLTFDYELKESSIKNNYILKPINVPLNLKIFNISNAIFTITYNPNEVKF